MRITKHKLGYRLVLCLVVLMLFFSDSSDEQELWFSACYNKLGGLLGQGPRLGLGPGLDNNEDILPCPLFPDACRHPVL